MPKHFSYPENSVGPAKVVCSCGHSRWSFYDPQFDRDTDGIDRAAVLARRHSRECPGLVVVSQHHSLPDIVRYQSGEPVA